MQTSIEESKKDDEKTQKLYEYEITKIKEIMAYIMVKIDNISSDKVESLKYQGSDTEVTYTKIAQILEGGHSMKIGGM